MDILSRLFGDGARVKVMRVFLLNPDRVYEAKDVADLARESKQKVVREIALLERVGFIRRKRFLKGERRLKARVVGWTLDRSFAYVEPLRSLMLEGLGLKKKEMVQRVRRAGNIKLIAVSGVFIRKWDSRLDVLVVGDRMKKGKLERMFKSFEADIGRELHYSILDTSDFRYRASVSDRLVRDVFDFSHEILLNKLDIAG